LHTYTPLKTVGHWSKALPFYPMSGDTRPHQVRWSEKNACAVQHINMRTSKGHWVLKSMQTLHFSGLLK